MLHSTQTDPTHAGFGGAQSVSNVHSTHTPPWVSHWSGAQSALVAQATHWPSWAQRGDAAGQSAASQHAATHSPPTQSPGCGQSSETRQFTHSKSELHRVRSSLVQWASTRQARQARSTGSQTGLSSGQSASALHSTHRSSTQTPESQSHCEHGQSSLQTPSTQESPGPHTSNPGSSGRHSTQRLRAQILRSGSRVQSALVRHSTQPRVGSHTRPSSQAAQPSNVQPSAIGGSSGISYQQPATTSASNALNDFISAWVRTGSWQGGLAVPWAAVGPRTGAASQSRLGCRS